MQFAKKTFLIALFFFFLIYHDSISEEILSWDDCVKEALKNNPELVSAREKLYQTKIDRTITRSSLYPQLSSNASKNTSRTEGFDQADNYSYTITGQLLLFDGFKTFYNVKISDKNIKSSQYNYKVVSAQKRLSLNNSFVNLLKEQEFFSILENIAKRRKQSVSLVKLRYDAGREHKGSVLTAQANLIQAEYDVAQSKRHADLAQTELLKELGRGKKTSIKVEGSLKINQGKIIKPQFERLVEMHPQVKESIEQKEISHLNIKSALSDFSPNLNTQASWGRSSDQWPPETYQWSVGLNLSISLFEGWRQRAGLSKAKSLFIQSQKDLFTIRNNTLVSLEEAWTKWQDALDQIVVQQKFLEAVKERSNIAQAQYSTGLISFTEWNTIEDELVNTEKNFLEVQANALIAEANWFYAKGVGIDEKQ